MTKKKEEKEDLIRESIKNDININMFVEAGAGAGKTTILIDRIINQFKSGDYKPEEIVAITFTKKAAEELKDRMVKRLNNEVIENTGKGKVFEYLQNAEVGLDKMQISTIHSFCLKLLMERALDAHLRMDVSLLEEDENDKDKEEFFSKWFKSNKRNYDKYKELTNLGIWKYYTLCQNAFNTMVNLLEDVVIEINQDLLKKTIDDFPKCYEKAADGTIKKDDYGNDKEDTKSQEYFNRTEYQSNFILDYVKPAVDEYRKIIKSHYVSNDLVLQKTRSLLLDKKAREYYKQKYKTIYVDEFQDTDKVQVDMLMLLCGDEKDGLRDGSLFVVGDPKQSIYRFRGADVPLYLEVKEYFSKQKNAKVYELNNNYRSNEKILDFVNYNANREFLHGYTNMNSKSKSNDFEDKKQLKGVYYLSRPTADSKYEKTKIKGYRKEVDIKYLIATINGLIESDRVIFDRELNNKEGGFRKIEYRDFLVLCKSTTHMDEYMDEMMKNNIPVQISSNVRTNKNKYLVRIKDIYGLITYSYDRKTKEAFAQSYYDNIFTKEKYVEFYSIEKYIKSATKDMDAYSKLLYISHNIDLYNDNNINVRENMVKRISTQVEQMVETVITTCANNEQDVYDGLCNFIEKGYEREIIEENNANAVRFMNLHKSKGLEGKIVIICKRSKYNEYDFSTVHNRDKKGKTHYYISFTEDKGFQKKYYPSYYNKIEIANQAKEEEESEFKRLAYVECTRAMEALIFLDLSYTKKDLFTEYDFDQVKSIFDEKDGLPEVVAKLDIEDSKKMKPIQYKGNEFLVKKELSQEKPTYEKITPSEHDEEDEKIIGDENLLEISGAVYGTIMHRVFELLVSNIRKNIDITSDKTNEMINMAIIESMQRIIDTYGEQYNDWIEKLKKVLLEDVDTFLNNKELQNDIKEATDVNTEQSFEILDDDKNLIKGQADLVLLNNENIIIVDYKSNYIQGKDAKDFKNYLYTYYEKQLNLYKYAFGKMYNCDQGNINTIIYNKYINN